MVFVFELCRSNRNVTSVSRVFKDFLRLVYFKLSGAVCPSEGWKEMQITAPTNLYLFMSRQRVQ